MSPMAHRFYRNIHLLAIPHHPGGLRLQADECADGLGGASLGDGFQQPSQHDQSDDDAHGLVVDLLQAL